MTYPLACDDIVQLTLILVSFNIYALTLSERPLGANPNHKQIIDLNFTYLVISQYHCI